MPLETSQPGVAPLHVGTLGMTHAQVGVAAQPGGSGLQPICWAATDAVIAPTDCM